MKFILARNRSSEAVKQVTSTLKRQFADFMENCVLLSSMKIGRGALKIRMQEMKRCHIIGQDLDTLALKGKNWSEKKLHVKIESTIGPWSEYFDVTVSRKPDEPRIKWNYKKSELRQAEKKDGKWLLVSTDDSISAHKAVNAYLEKDFIEKVFRVIKTQEEVQPVRHRLENRVRAYLFVCMLAYRLLAVLQWRLTQVSVKEDSWESANALLQDLSRVERVEVKFGNEIKTLYLNLSEKNSKSLKAIGMMDLFKEETRLDEKAAL